MRPQRGKRRRPSADSATTPNVATSPPTPTTTTNSNPPTSGTSSQGTNTPATTPTSTMKRGRGVKASGVQIITRYMCRYCGQQFDNMTDMDNHTMVHNGERAPHSCFVCGKSYRTPSKLQRHVRVHSGERPYACNVCGKRFTRSDHVKQHMKVHLPQKQKNVCRMCGMRFVRRQTLHDHLRGHGVTHVSSCNRCGEAFESAEMLQEHKAQHETLGIMAFPDDSLDGRVKVEGGVGPILGLAKFGLGPQPDVRESLDGIIKPESNNPASLIGRSSTANGDIHIGDDGEGGDSMGSTQPTVEVENAEDDGEPNAADPPPMSIAACFSLASALGGGSMPGLEELRSQTLGQDHVVVLPTSPPDAHDDDDDGRPRTLQAMVNHMVQRTMNGDLAASASSHGESRERNNKERTRQSKLRESLLESYASPSVFPESSLSSTYGMVSETSPDRAAAALTAVSAPPSTPPTQASTPHSLSPAERPLVPDGGGMSRRSKRFKGGNSYPKQTRVEAQMEVMEDDGEDEVATVAPTDMQMEAGNSTASPAEMGTALEAGGLQRCQHCCIWFEDGVMFNLHQNLHRADRCDPFTCRKCMKKLGNRLEFQAHIIWHLDPYSVYTSH